MNGYMTTKEAAEKWNITVRQVQNHCKNGRITGCSKNRHKLADPGRNTAPQIYFYM